MRFAASAAALAAAAAALPEALPAAQPLSSVWDGVYTESQARRAESFYPVACGKCHGYRLDGAPDDPDMFPTPPIAGRKFLRDWDGRTVAALFETIRGTMPANNPGWLSDAELAEAIAYMLYISGVPPGREALAADSASLATLLLGPAR